MIPSKFNKKYFIYFVFFIAGAFILLQQEATPNKVVPDLVVQIDEQAPTSLPEPSAQAQDEQKQFQQLFNKEAARLSQTDDDPEQTQRELEHWVETLRDEEIQQLRNMTLNSSAPGDERSLAVYLLSLSRDRASIPLLTEIALSPLPEVENDRLLSFEETLRAQAIEGLTNHPEKALTKSNLEKIAQSTESSFLADRSRRALSYLQQQAPHPKEQELKALNGLLNRPDKKSSR